MVVVGTIVGIVVVCCDAGTVECISGIGTFVNLEVVDGGWVGGAGCAWCGSHCVSPLSSPSSNLAAWNISPAWAWSQSDSCTCFFVAWPTTSRQSFGYLALRMAPSKPENISKSWPPSEESQLPIPTGVPASSCLTFTQSWGKLAHWIIEVPAYHSNL